MSNFKTSTTFGVEIEFTGISRQVAIETVRSTLGATGGIDRVRAYDEHSVRDLSGRKWKVVKDASIRTEGGSENSCELVTPPLTYAADMALLQTVVRNLRKAGGRVNNSCGIHVHLDGSRHTVRTLRNWINLVAGRNDLLYKALGVDPHRMHYCQKIDRKLVDAVAKAKPSTVEALADVWYKTYGVSDYDTREGHYHSSRYHFLNLHSYFQAEHHTVEIRGFNSTLHAGHALADSVAEHPKLVADPEKLKADLYADLALLVHGVA